MSFESLVIAFANRFLSDRTCELVITPALADLEFDDEAGRRSRLANRFAVLRALAGGLRDDIWRDSGSLLKVTMLSACYQMFPLVVGIEYFKTWSEFLVAMTMVLALSLVPVLVCFWPQRHTPRID